MSTARRVHGMFTGSSIVLSRVNFIRSDFFFTPDPSCLRAIRDYATGCLIAPDKNHKSGEPAFTVLKRYTSTGNLIEYQMRVKKDGEICLYSDDKIISHDTNNYLFNANVRDFVTAIINDTPFVLVRKFIPGLCNPLSLAHLNIAEANSVALELPHHLLTSSYNSCYLTIDRSGDVWYQASSFDKGIQHFRKPDHITYPLLRKIHDEHIAPLGNQFHSNEICMDTSRLVTHKY